MNTVEQYIAYFKYLCETHPAILHQDTVGKRAFETISIDEALGDFRTAAQEKGYMFRLIFPYWGFGDNYTADARLTIQGGFIIAKYHSDRKIGSPDLISAMDDSMQVAKDFAEKMVADAINKHPLFYHSIRTIEHLKWNAQPKIRAGDVNYSGYLCTFQFEQHFRNCLPGHDDAAWKTATPHTF